MDVSLLIRQRLSELALDQKDLAAAANVTESYISQLLARKKSPPAPNRTDLYEKIGHFLSLPSAELSKLAEVQRQTELKKKVAETPAPLFPELRTFIVHKCAQHNCPAVERIVEKEPFGELERLVGQTILGAVQRSASTAMHNRNPPGQLADFLTANIFQVSTEAHIAVLNSAVESWSIDLKTFAMEIQLNRAWAGRGRKRFEFAECLAESSLPVEPGFDRFLKDASLCGDATEEEIGFLRTLVFKGRRPSPLYYYRELQSLRDPLHFTLAE